jgi:O-antigen/teichoic acid export membrane protein
MSWRFALTPHRLRQLWYVPLLGTAMALMLVRVLLMARLLDVEGFAQFSAGLLISSSYSMLACLGLHSMLQRDLPVLLVRGQERRGVVLMAQCILVSLLLGTIGGLAALAGLSVAGLTPTLVAIGALHGLSQQVFLIVTVESRSRGHPLRFASQMMVRSASVVTVGLLAAVAFESAAAAIIAEALVSLALAQFSLGAVFRRASISALSAYRVGFRRMRSVHWRSALAFLSVSMMAFVMLYVDRWIAAEVLNPRLFALYAFAWTVLMVAQSLQMIVNASVYPLIARRFASHGAGTAFNISLRMSVLALVAGSVLAVPVWWLFDLCVRRWLSAYAPAGELIALFVAVAILRVSDFWTSFLMIVGLEARLLALNISVAAGASVIWILWAQPWQVAQLTPWDIGLFAALLTFGGYFANAAAAWWAVRR